MEAFVVKFLIFLWVGSLTIRTMAFAAEPGDTDEDEENVEIIEQNEIDTGPADNSEETRSEVQATSITIPQCQVKSITIPPCQFKHVENATTTRRYAPFELLKSAVMFPRKESSHEVYGSDANNVGPGCVAALYVGGLRVMYGSLRKSPTLTRRFVPSGVRPLWGRVRLRSSRGRGRRGHGGHGRRRRRFRKRGMLRSNDLSGSAERDVEAKEEAIADFCKREPPPKLAPHLGMTGDHMNINPRAPEFPLPPPRDTNFDKRWWYYHENDYHKPGEPKYLRDSI